MTNIAGIHSHHYRLKLSANGRLDDDNTTLLNRAHFDLFGFGIHNRSVTAKGLSGHC
jgi:hypothetical protein